MALTSSGHINRGSTLRHQFRSRIPIVCVTRHPVHNHGRCSPFFLSACLPKARKGIPHGATAAAVAIEHVHYGHSHLASSAHNHHCRVCDWLLVRTGLTFMYARPRGAEISSLMKYHSCERFYFNKGQGSSDIWPFFWKNINYSQSHPLLLMWRKDL